MNTHEYDIQYLTKLCETGLLPFTDTFLPSWSLQAYNRVLAECGGWIDPEFAGTKKLNQKKLIEPILIANYLLENSRGLLLEEGYTASDIDQMSHTFLYGYYRDRLELTDLKWLATNHVTAALAITLLTPFHETFLELKGAAPENITGNELIKIITAQACLASAQECHAMMTRDIFMAQQNSLEATGERKVIDFQLSEMALKAKHREGGIKGTIKASIKKEKTLVAGRQIIRELILRDKQHQLMTGHSAEIIREAVSQNWEQIDLSGPDDIPQEKWFREKVINTTPEALYMSSPKGKEHSKSKELFHSLLKCAGELYLPSK
jgi:hypothetical protein